MRNQYLMTFDWMKAQIGKSTLFVLVVCSIEIPEHQVFYSIYHLEFYKVVCITNEWPNPSGHKGC